MHQASQFHQTHQPTGLPALYMGAIVPVGFLMKDEQGQWQYGTTQRSGFPNNVLNGAKNGCCHICMLFMSSNTPPKRHGSCWLRYDTHFVWSFISPVILILTVRTAISLTTPHTIFKNCISFSHNDSSMC